MSHFNPSFLSGLAGDASQLDTELQNSLPTRWNLDYYVTPASVNDGTFQTLVSLTGISLQGDELMDCWAACNFSGTTAGDTIHFALYWNNVIVRDRVIAVPTGVTGTDGAKQDVCIRWGVVDFAGTSDLLLKARRIGGSGTFVIAGRDMQHFITKRRA